MGNTKTLIWTAVAVGVIALIAWWAFASDDGVMNAETNGTVEETDSQGVNTVASETETEQSEIAAARAKAQSEIVVLRARLAAEEGVENATAELERIRLELAEAYAGASAEAQTEWAAIAAEFDDVEVALRDGTGDALEFFADLALVLEGDVRIDAETDVDADMQ